MGVLATSSDTPVFRSMRPRTWRIRQQLPTMSSRLTSMPGVQRDLSGRPTCRSRSYRSARSPVSWCAPGRHPSPTPCRGHQRAGIRKISLRFSRNSVFGQPASPLLPSTDHPWWRAKPVDRYRDVIRQDRRDQAQWYDPNRVGSPARSSQTCRAAGCSCPWSALSPTRVRLRLSGSGRNGMARSAAP